MKGKGIERAKLYLEKVIKRNLHSDQNPWSEIKTLGKIRNAIVHKDGQANDEIKKDPNFKQHINTGRLKLKSNRKIIIESKYSDYILPKVTEFFNSIDVN